MRRRARGSRRGTKWGAKGVRTTALDFRQAPGYLESFRRPCRSVLGLFRGFRFVAVFSFGRIARAGILFGGRRRGGLYFRLVLATVAAGGDYSIALFDAAENLYFISALQAGFDCGGVRFFIASRKQHIICAIR